jgi:hypothetical protein
MDMNTLQCKQVSLAIEAFEPLSANLQSHADQCPVCQALLKQEMALKKGLAAAAPALPPHFTQRVMAQVSTLPTPLADKRTSTPTARNGFKTWFLPAAAAAVFVLVWVNSAVFIDNPVSNRLSRMSQADDWVMAHIGPSDHDFLDHDPTEEMLSETVDF